MSFWIWKPYVYRCFWEGADSSFSVFSATSATWRSTLRWRNTSAKLESKEYRSAELSLAFGKPPVHSRHKMPCSSVSAAPWDDAGDSGTPDWRCANSRCSHHVFHQAACVSLSSHLCSSLHSQQYHKSQYSHLWPPCYWFLLHPDHFASLVLVSSQKLDINWTGLTNLLDIPGLKWVMLELSLMGLSGP